MVWLMFVSREGRRAELEELDQQLIEEGRGTASGAPVLLGMGTPTRPCTGRLLCCFYVFVFVALTAWPIGGYDDIFGGYYF